jgi:uncharacterized membrane protein
MISSGFGGIEMKAWSRHGAALTVRAALLKSAVTAAAAAVVITGTVTGASAREKFLDQFKQVYTSVKSGGNIDNASCDLCHVGGPPKLNKYGMSVKAALEKANAKDVTADVLHSIDAVDSDGDGFSNGEEIAADTLPGDEKSHPAGAPKAAAKKVSAEESKEPSPFDVVGAIKAKHAQHPIIVHFPIGLFMASLLFDIIGRLKKSEGLNAAAYYNIVFSAITGVASVISGILCWQWKLGGDPLAGNLKLHLILGIVTSVLMFVLWGVRKGQAKKPTDPVSIGYLALALITVVIIALTGHVGGILSGVV